MFRGGRAGIDQRRTFFFGLRGRRSLRGERHHELAARDVMKHEQRSMHVELGFEPDFHRPQLELLGLATALYLEREDTERVAADRVLVVLRGELDLQTAERLR